MKKLLLCSLLVGTSLLTATGRKQGNTLTASDHLLILAAQQGNIEKVKQLIENNRVTSQGKNRALTAADKANTASPSDTEVTPYTLIIEYLFDQGAVCQD